jgi:4-alpha-glucanotransferase
LSEKPWRVAGVCVPVFALRSEYSYGVGDFGDLRRLVDWAVATGMKVIQLLPVNDTTVSHHWGDSNPYKIVSAFALHPHFMDLEQLGTLKDKKRMTVFRRRQRELNALSYSDYEAVERVKTEYVTELFKEIGEQTLCSNDYETWFEANKEWLKPYAEWMANRVENVEAQNAKLDFYYFVQYHLHCQLKAAVDYAHSKGVFLKGDLPIGIHQTSVETATHPAFSILTCRQVHHLTHIRCKGRIGRLLPMTGKATGRNSCLGSNSVCGTWNSISTHFVLTMCRAIS